MDIFIGVLANAGLVILGTAVGCLFKSDKLKRVGERVLQLFALFVVLLGVEGALGIKEPLKALIFMVVGTVIGELADLDKQFNRFGDWVQRKFSKSSGKDGASDNRFAEGFVQATLLFCIGSMTFMGAMESGIQHTHTIYYTKGMLDCMSALSLTSGYGIGVGFSALAVLVYQGLLTLLAGLLEPLLIPAVVSLCSQIGSVFLIGIGLNMLGVTKIKVANFLPAMFMPIIWQLITGLFA